MGAVACRAKLRVDSHPGTIICIREIMRRKSVSRDLHSSVLMPPPIGRIIDALGL